MKRRLIKKYKKQKAFTLIELLAVILILGIIALIAIPTVTSVVEQSRKGAFENSVNNITTAIETKCTMELLGTNGITKLYEFNEDGISPSVDIKGSLPKSGYARVNDKCEVLIYAVDGNYTVAKPFSDEKIEVVDKDTTVRPPELAKYTKVEIYKLMPFTESFNDGDEKTRLFQLISDSSLWNDSYIGMAIMYNDTQFENLSAYLILEEKNIESVLKLEQEVKKVELVWFDMISSICCDELVDEEKNYCEENKNNQLSYFPFEYFIYDNSIFVQIPLMIYFDTSAPFNDVLSAFHQEMKNNNAERILYFE